MARRFVRSKRSVPLRGTVLNSSAEPTKVLAVANGQRFTEQLSQLLSGHNRIRLLGGASDRINAAERLVLLKPDVVVIEADLDYELGGIDTAFALRTISPSTAFVIVSPYSDPERLAMVPRGLGLEWSYLLADSEMNSDDLVTAINSAAWSIPFIDPRIDRSQLGRLQNRVEAAVERVLEASRQKDKRSAPHLRRLGYSGSGDWDGKVTRFRLPEDLDSDPDDEGA